MKLIHTTLVVICVVSAIAAQASSPYQINRLGFLPGGGYSSALRVNNAGEVLGYSASFNDHALGVDDAFLWKRNSGMINIQAESHIELAVDMNNAGQISGVIAPDSGPTLGVLRQANGELLQLAGLPGAYGTIAYALNDNGWVVGTSGNYAVKWQGNTAAEIIGGTPGSESYAMDINNNGSIAWTEALYNNGQWVGNHSYVLNQGVNTLLQGLNISDNCQATSINDSGIVVGTSGNHAVAWGTDGKIILDLGIGNAYGINKSGQIVGDRDGGAVLWNPDGSIAADLGLLAGMTNSSVAYGINDSGQIVGAAGYNEYDDMEAVLWQPVPEPSCLIVLLCGIGGLTGYRVRRRNG